MKPIKIYADVLEESALKQFNDVMALPDVVQGALMPDAHTGYVLPIGAVVATEGTIYPSFVGYDIGCGMSATKLNIAADLIRENADAIKAEILKLIPVGFNKNDPEQMKRADQRMPTLNYSHNIHNHVNNGSHCLGTLGGGNHFIEIGFDEDGFAWIVIHSGSRTVGHKTAQFYMKLAAGDNIPFEAAYHLNAESEEGQSYIKDLEYCLHFALANRQLMSDLVMFAIARVIDKVIYEKQFINRNHNHAELVAGRWIHRKGATHADKGMWGVIPGNMRDGSFIVRGKGNAESMNSSSHGAGRVLSRSKAFKQITLEQFQESMKDIQCATVDEKHIDESPLVYKDIFEVMKLQHDLVDVEHHIKPIINIKG